MSELGGYTDSENVNRLFVALKDDARKAVDTLLATTRNPATIMKTLELHYGNKCVIAKKILNDLKEMPSIDSGKIKLLQFATKIKNAVTALKSLNLTGHLESSDLIQSITKKFPAALKYAYNEYAANVPEEQAGLEKVPNFLCWQAELSANGIFEDDVCEVTQNHAD
ncbi:hypothetical protein TSAR_002904 [Trichomalopsis sarcophagae]|uniref:Uncharacterized protein n=1 Tax=Trichomalopsis sarcophagae TaxID=543379 RepID=A0A232F7K9_9HYME|nr:hypothetical protein TSAR_002904 [Trichomalopsis sarcophagae]